MHWNCRRARQILTWDIDISPSVRHLRFASIQMQWILRPKKTCTTIFRRPVCRNHYFHSSPRAHFQFANALKQEAGGKAPSFRSKVAEETRQEAFTDKVGSPGTGKQILVRFPLVPSAQQVPLIRISLLHLAPC